MATTTISSNTYTRIYSDMTGLTYPDVDYDAFHFNLYYWSGSAWLYSQTTGEIYVNDATFITSPEYNYKVFGTAKYDGTWYDIGYSAEENLIAIPPPVISLEGKTNNTIFFTTALTVGNRATYWYGSYNNVNYDWYAIADIKLDNMYCPNHHYMQFNYTVDGNKLTFLNLVEWAYQSYTCFAELDGYYSVSAEDPVSQGYLYYFTYDDPPILADLMIDAGTITGFRMNVAGYTGGAYHIVDYEWDTYGSGYGEDYSVNQIFHVLTGLIPSTQYECRARLRNTTSGYYSDWEYEYPTTDAATTPNVPTNISVETVSDYHVNLFYQWGAWATSMDLRWGENGSDWDETYSSQSQNNYPAANYNIDTFDAGNKYFQVRSRRLELGWTTYSTWVNASPYPLNVILISRPSNWAWTTTVVQGGAIVIDNANKRLKPLTAVEWNAFGVRINDFRDYEGEADYSFTTVYTNTAMTAAICNEARTAINAMSPPTSVPAVAVQGDRITAAFFNGLKNALNSIT